MMRAVTTAGAGLVSALFTSSALAQEAASDNLVGALRAARASVRAAQEALQQAELACKAALPERDRHKCLSDGGTGTEFAALPPTKPAATIPAASAGSEAHTYQDAGAAAASFGRDVLGTDDASQSRSERRYAAGQVGSALSVSVLNGSSGSVIKYAKTPEFELLMTSKDKVGSLSWTISADDENDGSNYRSNVLTLTGTAKLNDGEGTFVTTDGFSGGTEAKLSFTQFNGKVNFGGFPTAMAAAQEAEVRCRAQQPSISATATPEEIKKAQSEMTKKCTAASYDDGGVPGFIERYYPESSRSISSAIFPGEVIYWGGSIGLNQTEFSYLDRAAFKKKDVSKLGFVGTAFGGALFNEGQTSLTGSFTYRRRYKASDSVELCQPTTPPTTQCLTGPDGAPQKKNATLFAIDFRHAIAAELWNYTRFAIAPRVSYDTTNKIATVDVPIYIARDEIGQLRGGFRAIYTDQPDPKGGRKDELILGLFVGLPFNIVGK